MRELRVAVILLAAAGMALGSAAAFTAAEATEARGPVLRQKHEPVTGSLANVCHLRVKRIRYLFVPGTFNSTAVLFGERYLLTAAHNVHSTVFSRVAGIRAACGKANPTDQDHAQIDLSRIRVAPGYTWRKWDRDFAVLELPTAIRTSRPMNLRPVTDEETGSEAILAGFPGTDERGAPAAMDGEHMFSAAVEPRLDPKSPLVRYDLKTYTGNSGGPLWLDATDGPLLIGVHVFGSGREGVARRLDTEGVALRAMIDSLQH